LPFMAATLISTADLHTVTVIGMEDIISSTAAGGTRSRGGPGTYKRLRILVRGLHVTMGISHIQILPLNALPWLLLSGRSVALRFN
jgi:hypothetical protein